MPHNLSEPMCLITFFSLEAYDFDGLRFDVNAVLGGVRSFLESFSDHVSTKIEKSYPELIQD